MGKCKERKKKRRKKETFLGEKKEEQQTQTKIEELSLSYDQFVCESSGPFPFRTILLTFSAKKGGNEKKRIINIYIKKRFILLT